MLQLMKDDRQLINFGRRVPGTAGESVFLSSQRGKNKHTYYHIVNFRENIFNCTALHAGLHKSNYFFYFTQNKYVFVWKVNLKFQLEFVLYET